MSRCHRIRIHQTVLALTASAAFLFAGTASFAQVAYDAQIPFSYANLNDPTGIAVAPDGTVYVADIQSGTKAHLVRITPTTGAVGGGSGNSADIAATGQRLTPTGVTMQDPIAVVADSTGALYVADGTAGKVFKIASPESSASPAATAIPYGGTQTPTALAVDSANNLYIADQTQGAIYEVTGGVATKLSIGTGFQPAGLAVDNAGDVYFADLASNQIYEYSASTMATSTFLSTTSVGNFNFSGSHFVLPVGMGVDPAGDVYIMDSGNSRLIEATSKTNTFEVPFSSITNPGSLALSSTGNIYLTDDSNDAVDELYYNNNPVNFGSIPASYAGNTTTSPTITINYNFISQTNSVAYYQTMQGDSMSEFSEGGFSGCGASGVGTVSAGTQCSVTANVQYQSSIPGVRIGAVGLTDGNKDILAVPTMGIGVAGSLALYPGTQSVLSQSSQTMLYEPQGLAVSGNGNWFFIADTGAVISGGDYTYANPAVWAYPVTNGVISSTRSQVGGPIQQFVNPTAVALDADGNLYVADFSGYVRKIPPAGNWDTAGTLLTLPAGITLNHPIALAIDPSGNLYIGDGGPLGLYATASNPGYIVKVPADGGPANTLNYTVSGTPVIFPESLTTDSYGNLYIADGGDASNDSNTGGVDVVTAATGAISAVSFGSYGSNANQYSLYYPSSVNFDAAGDLYVLDGYNERVLVEPINYTGSTPVPDSNDVATLGYGNSGFTTELVTPSNMVVWPGGQSITISDIGYASGGVPAQVLTLNAMNAAPLAVAPSGSVMGINVGNQEITFKTPSISGSNSSSFSVSGCGSDTSTLEPGIVNACTATVNYSGSGLGNATITLLGNSNKDYSALGNQIPVTAQPNGPVAQVTAGSLVTVPAGGFSVTVTITNVGGDGGGSDPLNISYFEIHNPRGASWVGGTCYISENLNSNASCTVVVGLVNDGRYRHGNVRFTDNSGDAPGTIQKECAYVDYNFVGVTGGGYSGFCRGGGIFGAVQQGPITTNTGNSNTIDTPGSTQSKVGLVNGALSSQSQAGSSNFRQGSGAAQQGDAVQPQNGSQPVSTIQSGSTPQAGGSYLPLGLVQPSFIAPDDASAATDDSSIDSDSSTSDQDGTTKKKKKSHKSNSENSGSASNASASGDAAPQQ